MLRSVPRVAGAGDQPVLPTDSELVRAARAGDPWAAEALVRRHARAVNGLALRLLGRDGDVDDFHGYDFHGDFRGDDLRGDVLRFEDILGIAEFARHRDHSILNHVIAIIPREAAEHCSHVIARAGAFGVQGSASEHTHTALVEKSIKQPLAGQVLIDELDIVDGRNQRASLNPSFVLWHDVRRHPLGRIARVKIGAAHSLSLLG